MAGEAIGFRQSEVNVFVAGLKPDRCLACSDGNRKDGGWATGIAGIRIHTVPLCLPGSDSAPVAPHRKAWNTLFRILLKIRNSQVADLTVALAAEKAIVRMAVGP